MSHMTGPDLAPRARGPRPPFPRIGGLLPEPPFRSVTSGLRFVLLSLSFGSEIVVVHDGPCDRLDHSLDFFDDSGLRLALSTTRGATFLFLTSRSVRHLPTQRVFPSPTLSNSHVGGVCTQHANLSLSKFGQHLIVEGCAGRDRSVYFVGSPRQRLQSRYIAPMFLDFADGHTRGSVS